LDAEPANDAEADRARDVMEESDPLSQRRHESHVTVHDAE
jgi:hypothetical protein